MTSNAQARFAHLFSDLARFDCYMKNSLWCDGDSTTMRHGAGAAELVLSGDFRAVGAARRRREKAVMR